MGVDKTLDIIRSVALVNPSKALKLLEKYQENIEAEINSPVRCPYRLTKTELHYFGAAHSVEPSQILSGRDRTSHPISASLRDDATNKTVKWVCKLAGNKKHIRLVNPKASVVNRLINDTAIEHFDLFIGSFHQSDIKRPPITTRQIRNKREKDVYVSFYDALNFDDVLAPQDNTLLVLFDDIYHLDPDAVNTFIVRSVNSTIISAMNLLPVLAVLNQSPINTYFGARVETYKKTKNGEEVDFYRHYLEDGTSYNGSFENIRRLLQTHSRTNFSKTYEPLNNFHGLMIMGLTNGSMDNEITIKIPDHIMIRRFDANHPSNSYANRWFLLPASIYYKFRNYLRASELKNLTFAKANAYLRNQELSQFLPDNVFTSLFYVTLNEVTKAEKDLVGGDYLSLNYPICRDIFGSFKAVLTEVVNLFTCTSKDEKVSYSLYLPEVSFITVMEKIVCLDLNKLPRKLIRFPARSKNTPLPSGDVQPPEEPAKFLPSNVDYGKEKYFYTNFSKVTDCASLALFPSMGEAGERVRSLLASYNSQTPCIIDHWVNGVAGSGKTVTYTDLFKNMDLDLMDYVILTPTTDLATEIGEKMDKIRPGWRTVNPYLIQTYMRGLLKATGKHVIVDEAWLMPSFITIALSCMRGANDIVSLMIVGDKMQHLFNEEIIAEQEWTKTMKMLKYCSRKIELLTTCYRCGPQVVEMIKYLDPDMEIESGNVFDTQVSLVKTPMNVIGAKYFCQSGQDEQFWARRGCDAVTTVSGQGASVKIAHFTPSAKYYFDGIYVGLTRATDKLIIYVRDDREADRKIIAAYEHMQKKLKLGTHAETQAEITLEYVPGSEEIVQPQPVVIPKQPEIIKKTNKHYGNVEVSIRSRVENLHETLATVATSAEVQKKVEILSTIVDVPLDHTAEIVPDLITFDDDVQLSQITFSNSNPQNLIDLSIDNQMDEVENDIISLSHSNAVAQHSQKNKALVGRSLKASFAQNPGLVDVDVDIAATFPELAAFEFVLDDVIFGKYADRYLKKLRLGGLSNQILEDVNENLMSFKNQLKGGITSKNKVNNTKVGQIVRASSKFYQIKLGIVMNAFFDQLDFYYRDLGHFTGCQGSDVDAQIFLIQVPSHYNAISFDTVKNESRVDETTKAFERKFMVHFSQGILDGELLEQHDTQEFIMYKDEKIMLPRRNSGCPGTLPRNWLANFCMIRLRTLDLPNVQTMIKGDNSVVFAGIPRSELLNRFSALALDGMIEIDSELEWTSYKLINQYGKFKMLPNYSYIGERFHTRMILPTKPVNESEIKNYRVLCKDFQANEALYALDYPELFNDYAYLMIEQLYNKESFTEVIFENKIRPLESKALQLLF